MTTPRRPPVFPLILVLDPIPTDNDGGTLAIRVDDIELHGESHPAPAAVVTLRQVVGGELVDDEGIVIDEAHLRTIGLRLVSLADDIDSYRAKATYPTNIDASPSPVVSRALEEVVIDDGAERTLTARIDRATYANTAMTAMAGGRSKTRHTVVLQEMLEAGGDNEEPAGPPIRVDEGSLLDLIAMLTEGARLISLSHVNRNHAEVDPAMAAEFDPMRPDPDLNEQIERLSKLADRIAPASPAGA